MKNEMMKQQSIHTALSIFIIAISPITYFILTRIIAAPFGKHSVTSSSSVTGQSRPQKWGPSLNPKLAWFLFESPNLLWCIYGYVHRNREVFDGQHANAVLFSLFIIHYLNRCVIYPLQMTKGSSTVNLAILSSAFLFCSINGFLQAQNYCQFQSYPEDYHTSVKFIVGVVLWMIGFVINLHSDSILRNLRKTDADQQPNSGTPSKYKIPYGGFYERVSCANFFGEIIEWLGYAIASSSLAAWSFWMFACANLIPRGISHHQWYLDKFDDYPKDRYAVIPFVV